MKHRTAAIVSALTATILLLSSVAAAQFGARPPNRSSLLDDGALHVVICGSGSPLPSVERAGPCTAVIAGGRMFLIDVGPGSTENLRLWGLPMGSLAGVLLTHFHSDHIGELGEVVFASWTGGRAVPLDVYGVSGDTIRSANVEAASQGVDVLVHEVLSGALIGGAAQALESAGNERTAKMLRDTLDYHTFPADVHALAADAQVKLLVLSHLVPPLPAAQAEGVFMRGRAEDAPNDAVVGADGMHIALPANSDERTIENF